MAFIVKAHYNSDNHGYEGEKSRTALDSSFFASAHGYHDEIVLRDHPRFSGNETSIKGVAYYS